MATSKIWKIDSVSYLKKSIDYIENQEKTDRKLTDKFENFASVRNALRYVMNPEKTVTDSACFVTGIHCDYYQAEREFLATKQRYHKEDGIQAWAAEVSFKGWEVTPEVAHEIGIELAQKFWPGCEVVVTTHLNTDNIHDHFIINSVNKETGRRVHEGTTWFNLRKEVDAICQARGLSVVEHPQFGGSRVYRSKLTTVKETQAEITKRYVDAAIASSYTVGSFRRCLLKMGCSVRMDPQISYWSVRVPGYTRPLRLYHIGEDYTNEGIMKRLLSRQKELPETLYYVPKSERLSTRQYRLPKRHDYVKKHRGRFERQYLRYCYLLGAIPTYQKRSYYAIPPSMREDMKRLERLTEQATLLAQNHIETSEDLAAYSGALTVRKEGLLQTQKQLQSARRRKTLSSEEEYGITAELQNIHRELILINRSQRTIRNITDDAEPIRKALERYDRGDVAGPAIELPPAAMQTERLEKMPETMQAKSIQHKGRELS